MKAAGYIRVSTDEQVNGTSLDTQRQQIEAYAAMKGLSLVDVFSDNGISGTKALAERPEGSRLTDLVASKTIRTIIIVKLDRGFRNVVDCLQSVDAWERQGVALHIVDLGGNAIDSSSPAGRFMLTVLSAAAEMEHGMIRDRCAQGKAARKAEGKRTGEIPFGQSVGNGGVLIDNPTERAAIRRILELSSGGASVRKVAGTMNQEGYVTRKGAWTHTQVHRVIQKSRI